MRQTHHKHLIRGIALCLLAAFGTESAASAAPVAAPLAGSLFEKKMRLPFDLPLSAGVLEDMSAPPSVGSDLSREPRPVVYLIQDAHTNPSAQKNIARIIDTILSNDSRVTAVYSEAGNRGTDYALTRLKQGTSLQTRQAAALPFLNKGLLQGSEYASLIGRSDFKLMGLEDPALYDEALAVYAKVSRSRPIALRYLAKIERTLLTLKPGIYSPALIELDRLKNACDTGEMPLSEYLEHLVSIAKTRQVRLDRYPHLEKAEALLQLEKSIDFNRVQDDLHAALEDLGSDDRDLFESQPAAQRLSSKNPQETLGYFLLLEEKLKARGKPTEPDLQKYLTYLQQFEKTNPQSVLREQKELEEVVFAASARTPDQRILKELTDSFHTLKDLFELKLTPEEHRALLAKPRLHDASVLTGFLNRKIMDSGRRYELTVFLEQDYPALYREALNFYRLAGQRDEAFLQNLLASLREPQPTPVSEAVEPSAIMITGGFHTPHLKELLRRNGFAHYSIIPQVSCPTDSVRYEKILLSTHAPQNPPFIATHSPATSIGARLGLATPDLALLLPAVPLAQTSGAPSVAAARMAAQSTLFGAQLKRYVIGTLVGLWSGYPLFKSVYPLLPSMTDFVLASPLFYWGAALGGFIVHEFGHALGGWITGAKVGWSMFSRLLYHERVGQRIAFLLGGPLLNLLVGSGVWTAFYFANYTEKNTITELAAYWGIMNLVIGIGAFLPLSRDAGGGLIYRLWKQKDRSNTGARMADESARPFGQADIDAMFANAEREGQEFILELGGKIQDAMSEIETAAELLGVLDQYLNEAGSDYAQVGERLTDTLQRWGTMLERLQNINNQLEILTTRSPSKPTKPRFMRTVGDTFYHTLVSVKGEFEQFQAEYLSEGGLLDDPYFTAIFTSEPKLHDLPTQLISEQGSLTQALREINEAIELLKSNLPNPPDPKAGARMADSGGSEFRRQIMIPLKVPKRSRFIDIGYGISLHYRGSFRSGVGSFARVTVRVNGRDFDLIESESGNPHNIFLKTISRDDHATTSASIDLLMNQMMIIGGRPDVEGAGVRVKVVSADADYLTVDVFPPIINRPFYESLSDAQKIKAIYLIDRFFKWLSDATLSNDGLIEGLGKMDDTSLLRIILRLIPKDFDLDRSRFLVSRVYNRIEEIDEHAPGARMAGLPRWSWMRAGVAATGLMGAVAGLGAQSAVERSRAISPAVAPAAEADAFDSERAVESVRRLMAVQKKRPRGEWNEDAIILLNTFAKRNLNISEAVPYLTELLDRALKDKNNTHVEWVVGILVMHAPRGAYEALPELRRIFVHNPDPRVASLIGSYGYRALDAVPDLVFHGFDPALTKKPAFKKWDPKGGVVRGAVTWIFGDMFKSIDHLFWNENIQRVIDVLQSVLDEAAKGPRRLPASVRSEIETMQERYKKLLIKSDGARMALAVPPSGFNRENFFAWIRRVEDGRLIGWGRMDDTYLKYAIDFLVEKSTREQAWQLKAEFFYVPYPELGTRTLRSLYHVLAGRPNATKKQFLKRLRQLGYSTPESTSPLKWTVDDIVHALKEGRNVLWGQMSPKQHASFLIKYAELKSEAHGRIIIVDQLTSKQFYRATIPGWKTQSLGGLLSQYDLPDKPRSLSNMEYMKKCLGFGHRGRRLKEIKTRRFVQTANDWSVIYDHFGLEEATIDSLSGQYRGVAYKLKEIERNLELDNQKFLFRQIRSGNLAGLRAAMIYYSPLIEMASAMRGVGNASDTRYRDVLERQIVISAFAKPGEKPLEKRFWNLATGMAKQNWKHTESSGVQNLAATTGQSESDSAAHSAGLHARLADRLDGIRAETGVEQDFDATDLLMDWLRGSGRLEIRGKYKLDENDYRKVLRALKRRLVQMGASLEQLHRGRLKAWQHERDRRLAKTLPDKRSKASGARMAVSIGDGAGEATAQVATLNEMLNALAGTVEAEDRVVSIALGEDLLAPSVIRFRVKDGAVVYSVDGDAEAMVLSARIHGGQKEFSVKASELALIIQQANTRVRHAWEWKPALRLDTGRGRPEVYLHLNEFLEKIKPGSELYEPMIRYALNSLSAQIPPIGTLHVLTADAEQERVVRAALSEPGMSTAAKNILIDTVGQEKPIRADSEQIHLVPATATNQPRQGLLKGHFYISMERPLVDRGNIRKFALPAFNAAGLLARILGTLPQGTKLTTADPQLEVARQFFEKVSGIQGISREEFLQWIQGKPTARHLQLPALIRVKISEAIQAVTQAARLARQSA